MTSLEPKFAESIKSLGIDSVYGDPVDVDGTTIIPVAFVHFGFGAGSDATHNDDASAAGGIGGAGVALPIGAYVKDEFGLRFRPNVITALVASIPVIFVGGRALARVVRALKR